MQPFKFLIALLVISLFTISTSQAGGIKIKLYGSGGIVSEGDVNKICPVTDPNKVCANLTVEEGVLQPDGTITNASALLEFEATESTIQIIEMSNIVPDGSDYGAPAPSLIFQ